jgi:precorrin-2 methylase
LYVVGLGLGDKKDVTVKGLEALPFEAFDSAVGQGRSEHGAQTTKVARGR